jgi:predicted transposase YbfD/YdcC
MLKGFIGRLITPSQASRRWRERNPDKVRVAQRNRPPRAYDSDYRKKWWASLSEDRKSEKMLVSNKRATKIRRWLDAFKMNSGCIDCGYRKHHSALHFDHVSGNKEINVCNAKSIRQAQREIVKCVVRCANCHAEKTFTFYPCKPDIFAATYEQV